MELERLKHIIAQVLSVDMKEISLDTKFVADLGADSLDLYQILLESEKEFDIVIEEMDLMLVETVGQALMLVQDKK